MELTDQSQDRPYNEWHQLDHLPANQALPGVAWGDNWGRPAHYQGVDGTVEQLAKVDCVTMYWFRSP